MKQQILDIIRTQWPKRHNANAHTRIQARNLILVHVALARKIRISGTNTPATHRANLIAPLYQPVLHAA